MQKKILIIAFLIISFTNVFAQNFDIDLLKKIHLNRNENFDAPLEFFSDTTRPVSVATPIVIYAIGYFSEDKTLKNKALFVAETSLISAGLTYALKYSIKKERPYKTYPFIEKITDGGSPSFPSGHTSEAFATATSLCIVFPKWYVIVPASIWATSIAYSRMHLGVHYPSDVLAGAILGSGSAYLSYKLNKWINKKTKI
jgi:membrane-associated phospholipid phosphatase